MQSRTDRIHFPIVDPDILWSDVPDVPSPVTPESGSMRDENRIFDRTPILSTPIQPSPALFDSQSRNYFKNRELAGLVTPARTPSDILFRGPLYAGSSECEDAESRSCLGTPLSSVGARETTPLAFSGDSDVSEGGRADLERKLTHHRERQEAIRDAIKEYEAKMTELMNWHREQERDILIRLTGEPSTGSSSSSRGSTRLRRGRSKLSERLYAAIELNT